jgi:hypothetical protein
VSCPPLQQYSLTNLRVADFDTHCSVEPVMVTWSWHERGSFSWHRPCPQACPASASARCCREESRRASAAWPPTARRSTASGRGRWGRPVGLPVSGTHARCSGLVLPSWSVLDSCFCPPMLTHPADHGVGGRGHPALRLGVGHGGAGTQGQAPAG